MCVFFRLLYNKILTSMTVIIECISWLINVSDNNDVRWKPEINTYIRSFFLFFVLNFMLTAHRPYIAEAVCNT